MDRKQIVTSSRCVNSDSPLLAICEFVPFSASTIHIRRTRIFSRVARFQASFPLPPAHSLGVLQVACISTAPAVCADVTAFPLAPALAIKPHRTNHRQLSQDPTQSRLVWSFSKPCAHMPTPCPICGTQLRVLTWKNRGPKPMPLRSVPHSLPHRPSLKNLNINRCCHSMNFARSPRHLHLWLPAPRPHLSLLCRVLPRRKGKGAL
jgi:hypothetical protein